MVTAVECVCDGAERWNHAVAKARDAVSDAPTIHAGESKNHSAAVLTAPAAMRASRPPVSHATLWARPLGAWTRYR